MSTNTQQQFDWPAELELGGERAVCERVTDEVDPARKCSTCRAVIGVNAVTCDECFLYCMGGTSP